MAIYVLRAFDKNTKGEEIDDAKLCTAALEIMAGKYEASLGGGVFKKRIPLKAGKSGGARAVVAFKLGKNLFFVNGYSKSDTRGSGREIPEDILKAYRRFATDLLALTPTQLDAQKRAHTLREVKCNG